jgi:hypothetical protein
MVRVISVLPSLKTTSKSALLLLAVFVGAGAMHAADAPRFIGPFLAGLMAEPKNREASGLAASRRATGLIWTHNDSGGEAVLYALGTDGALRGSVRLAGVENRDWEDLAAFELDGRAWLLAADSGDNFARNVQSMLYVIEEPDPSALSPARALVAPPAYPIHFVYEDGAHDCEAVAVDARERAVYLLTKRDVPARLYRVPLAPTSATQPAVARLVGMVPHLPRPNFWGRFVSTPSLAYRGEPTAMDFLSDDSAVLVLTYGALLYFPRTGGESWVDALARAPRKLPGFVLPQAEGACFTPDGREIYLASEKSLQLLRYLRRE